jgi:PTH1 family peptidyl-tRNA hydrolase
VKLIVGLGNPGSVYADSRHNIGFSVIKALAKKHKIALRKDAGSGSLIGKGTIEGQDVVLAMPLTFMNLSGKAVSALVKKYGVGLENLLVICDDLDLKLSRIKIKSCGSSGGHRGLNSITNALKTQHVGRLRIGIGRPPEDADIAEYVLSRFTRQDKKNIKESLKNAVACCRVWVSDGIAKSMNIFNRRGQMKT